MLEKLEGMIQKDRESGNPIGNNLIYSLLATLGDPFILDDIIYLILIIFWFGVGFFASPFLWLKAKIRGNYEERNQS